MTVTSDTIELRGCNKRTTRVAVLAENVAMATSSTDVQFVAQQRTETR